MSRTISHVPKDIRAIEVRLYIVSDHDDDGDEFRFIDWSLTKRTVKAQRKV